MGTTFTALLLRKFRTNYQYTLRHLSKCLEGEGYVPADDPKKADVVFSRYLFERQGWQMVTGDAASLFRMAGELAEHNGAEALLVSCCDSDFVELVLFNPLDGTQTRARCGRSYDESDPPKIEQERWQAVSTGRQKIDFEEIFEKQRLFAEEALVELGEALAFDGAAVVDAACGEGGDPDDVLYLSLGNLPHKWVDEGMPRLERRAYFDRPIPVDEPYQWSFMNRGGPSTGVELLIYGPFVENDQMMFTDVSMQVKKEPETNDTQWWRFEPQKPIQKIRLTNGWYAYRYLFPDLPLNPGLNPEYTQLRPDYALAAALSVEVSVTARGDARCGLDVYFSVVPLNCPDRNRGFAWTVCGVENHEKWIAEQNAWYEQCGNPKDFLLDPKNFEY